MSGESALAFGAGAAVAALAAAAGFLRLRRAAARNELGPPALLQATALRFALTAFGALGLALGWRERAAPALAGVGATYLALLAVETRWSIATAKAAGTPREKERS